MFLFILISALIVIPLSSVWPIIGTDVWYPQFVITVFFVFSALAYQISKMSKAIALFFFYCVISTVFIDRLYPTALIEMVQMGGCLLIATSISSLSEQQRKKVWYAIVAVLVLQSTLGILQMIGIDPFFRMKADYHLVDVCGFSGGRNQYGLSLASTAMAAIALCPYIIPFVLIAMFGSKTLTTLIAFIVACLFFISKRTSKIKALMIMPVALVLIPVFLHFAPKTSNKLYERVAIWNLTINQVNAGKITIPVNENIKKVVTGNVLTGYGMSSFFKLSPSTQGNVINKAYDYRYEHAHNDYVETYFDLGLIGIAFLVWIFAEIIFMFHVKRNRTKLLIASASALIVYAVSAMSIYTVHTAVSGFYLAVFVGLFYGALKDSEVKNA